MKQKDTNNSFITDKMVALGRNDYVQYMKSIEKDVDVNLLPTEDEIKAHIKKYTRDKLLYIASECYYESDIFLRSKSLFKQLEIASIKLDPKYKNFSDFLLDWTGNFMGISEKMEDIVTFITNMPAHKELVKTIKKRYNYDLNLLSLANNPNLNIKLEKTELFLEIFKAAKSINISNKHIQKKGKKIVLCGDNFETFNKSSSNKYSVKDETIELIYKKPNNFELYIDTKEIKRNTFFDHLGDYFEKNILIKLISEGKSYCKFELLVNPMQKQCNMLG